MRDHWPESPQTSALSDNEEALQEVIRTLEVSRMLGSRQGQTTIQSNSVKLLTMNDTAVQHDYCA